MFVAHPLPAVLQTAAGNEGITLGGILHRIPHDPVSVFVYLLLLAGVAGILWVGRARPADGDGMTGSEGP
ncbi:MAG: hypothetical protein PVI57_21545 [Gemmatimonadota bacterium]|jgi:hypothetical protein